MTSTIAVLLQLAASLLTGAQHNPQMSLAAQRQIVAMAGQTIQLSTQALAKINFPVPLSSSMYPTAGELMVAPYLDSTGAYVKLGQSVQLVDSAISFGDVNGDGVDDAMVVVKNGSPQYFLAAMLNQGGILFNIADVPLGSGVQVYSHQIQNGEFIMTMAMGNQPSSTVRYVLLGNQLIKE